MYVGKQCIFVKPEPLNFQVVDIYKWPLFKGTPHLVSFTTCKAANCKNLLSDLYCPVNLWGKIKYKQCYIYVYTYVSLCVSGSKAKAGIQLKCIQGKLCTWLVDKPLIQTSCYSNPQCNVTVSHKVSYTKCYLNIIGGCKYSTPSL